MKRYRDDRPADICFARGTFNSHPYVMAAMNEFLLRIESPEIRTIYARRMSCGTRAPHNSMRRLVRPACRSEVRNLYSIWTVCYTRPRATTGCCSIYLRDQGWR